MRQWKTTISSEYEIDQRTREDILLRLRTLAASYVPEWQFSEENPDIGSVIALLYADQMEENRKKRNLFLERCYTELVNMMGISLKPASPAHSVAVVRMMEDTIPGISLPVGTKLIADSTGEEESGRKLIFETAYSTYLTASRLKYIFMVSGRNGKMIPILGEYPRIVYAEAAETEPAETDAEKIEVLETQSPRTVGGERKDLGTSDGEARSESISQGAAGFPFTLFDFRKEGYGKQALLMYHSYLFDVEENEIRMYLQGGEAVLRGILEGRFTLSYYGEGKFWPVENLRLLNPETLAFEKQGKCRKTRLGSQEYSLLVLEAKEEQTEPMEVTDIRFSSVGEAKVPDMVWNGSTELEAESFAPFGRTMNLYSEVYIGQDSYFRKTGACVTLAFQVHFEENMLSIPREQEEDELKIIKKKPKKQVLDTAVEVYAQEISLEYFNGAGWRRLETDRRISGIFAEGKAGEIQFSFRAPADWAETEAGGFQGLCLRMQLLQADNCYFLPAVHHYPVISGMRISYTYEGLEEKPQRLISYCGSKKTDLGAVLAADRPISVFAGKRYRKTALYLGFGEKMESGPVSLFLWMKEMQKDSPARLEVSYSAAGGFRRLRVSDTTEGLSHTGTIRFLPPSDMAAVTLEGQKAYWLVLAEEGNQWETYGADGPQIYGIEINGVEVDNVETLEEEEYYVDEIAPNMSFALHAGNILSAEVWVNETTVFSDAEKKRLLKENPECYQAERDFMGNIESFYVKWEEVDHFDTSQAGDRHYCLDRMNSLLYFGDGIHVQIPRNTESTAVKVKLKCCGGEEGNVKAGQIQDSMGNLLFVEQIYNPVQAYGGKNRETMESALHRGTDLINSRKRLISVQDYEREVLCYSSRISQVKAVTGLKRDGRKEDGCISLVVLMDDFQDGSLSFSYIKPGLWQHLLTECELGVSRRNLELAEPLFVEISVEVWVSVQRADEVFQVQEALLTALEDYLNPVKNERWEIGRLPSRSQIELKLHMEKGRAILKHIMVTASYRDETGRHETELSALSRNPFAAVRNGRHRIHFEQNQEALC